jgi:hypothetical protein
MASYDVVSKICQAIGMGGSRRARRGEIRGVAPGKAVQLEPMIPVLKPPGIERLKPEYDELLSKIAFNFNLRRYILRSAARRNLTWRAAERCLRAAFGARFWRCAATRHTLSDKLLLRRPVGRRRLSVSKPKLNARLVSALKTEM